MPPLVEEASKQHVDGALADLRLFVESRCTEEAEAKDATTLMPFREAAMHFLRNNRRRNINLAAFKISMRQLGWSECDEQVTQGSEQRHVRAWVKETDTKVYLALTER